MSVTLKTHQPDAFDRHWSALQTALSRVSSPDYDADEFGRLDLTKLGPLVGLYAAHGGHYHLLFAGSQNPAHVRLYRTGFDYEDPADYLGGYMLPPETPDEMLDELIPTLEGVLTSPLPRVGSTPADYLVHARLAGLLDDLQTKLDELRRAENPSGDPFPQQNPTQAYLSGKSYHFLIDVDGTQHHLLTTPEGYQSAPLYEFVQRLEVMDLNPLLPHLTTADGSTSPSPPMSKFRKLPPSTPPKPINPLNIGKPEPAMDSAASSYRKLPASTDFPAEATYVQEVETSPSNIVHVPNSVVIPTLPPTIEQSHPGIDPKWLKPVATFDPALGVGEPIGYESGTNRPLYRLRTEPTEQEPTLEITPETRLLLDTMATQMADGHALLITSRMIRKDPPSNEWRGPHIVTENDNKTWSGPHIVDPSTGAGQVTEWRGPHIIPSAQSVPGLDISVVPYIPVESEELKADFDAMNTYGLDDNGLYLDMIRYEQLPEPAKTVFALHALWYRMDAARRGQLDYVVLTAIPTRGKELLARYWDKLGSRHAGKAYLPDEYLVRRDVVAELLRLQTAPKPYPAGADNVLAVARHDPKEEASYAELAKLVKNSEGRILYPRAQLSEGIDAAYSVLRRIMKLESKSPMGFFESEQWALMTSLRLLSEILDLDFLAPPIYEAGISVGGFEMQMRHVASSHKKDWTAEEIKEVCPKFMMPALKYFLDHRSVRYLEELGYKDFPKVIDTFMTWLWNRGGFWYQVNFKQVSLARQVITQHTGRALTHPQIPLDTLKEFEADISSRHVTAPDWHDEGTVTREQLLGSQEQFQAEYLNSRPTDASDATSKEYLIDNQQYQYVMGLNALYVLLGEAKQNGQKRIEWDANLNDGARAIIQGYLHKRGMTTLTGPGTGIAFEWVDQILWEHFNSSTPIFNPSAELQEWHNDKDLVSLWDVILDSRPGIVLWRRDEMLGDSRRIYEVYLTELRQPHYDQTHTRLLWKLWEQDFALVSSLAALWEFGNGPIQELTDWADPARRSPPANVLPTASQTPILVPGLTENDRLYAINGMYVMLRKAQANGAVDLSWSDLDRTENKVIQTYLADRYGWSTKHEHKTEVLGEWINGLLVQETKRPIPKEFVPSDQLLTWRHMADVQPAMGQLRQLLSADHLRPLIPRQDLPDAVIPVYQLLRQELQKAAYLVDFFDVEAHGWAVTWELNLLLDRLPSNGLPKALSDTFGNLAASLGPDGRVGTITSQPVPARDESYRTVYDGWPSDWFDKGEYRDVYALDGIYGQLSKAVGNNSQSVAWADLTVREDNFLWEYLGREYGWSRRHENLPASIPVEWLQRVIELSYDTTAPSFTDPAWKLDFTTFVESHEQDFKGLRAVVNRYPHAVLIPYDRINSAALHLYQIIRQSRRMKSNLGEQEFFESDKYALVSDLKWLIQMLTPAMQPVGESDLGIITDKSGKQVGSFHISYSTDRDELDGSDEGNEATTFETYQYLRTGEGTPPIHLGWPENWVEVPILLRTFVLDELYTTSRRESRLNGTTSVPWDAFSQVTTRYLATLQDQSLPIQESTVTEMLTQFSGEAHRFDISQALITKIQEGDLSDHTNVLMALNQAPLAVLWPRLSVPEWLRECYDLYLSQQLPHSPTNALVSPDWLYVRELRAMLWAARKDGWGQGLYLSGEYWADLQELYDLLMSGELPDPVSTDFLSANANSVPVQYTQSFHPGPLSDGYVSQRTLNQLLNKLSGAWDLPNTISIELLAQRWRPEYQGDFADLSEALLPGLLLYPKDALPAGVLACYDLLFDAYYHHNPQVGDKYVKTKSIIPGSKVVMSYVKVPILRILMEKVPGTTEMFKERYDLEQAGKDQLTGHNLPVTELPSQGVYYEGEIRGIQVFAPPLDSLPYIHYPDRQRVQPVGSLTPEEYFRVDAIKDLLTNKTTRATDRNALSFLLDLLERFDPLTATKNMADRPL